MILDRFISRGKPPVPKSPVDLGRRIGMPLSEPTADTADSGEKSPLRKQLDQRLLEQRELNNLLINFETQLASVERPDQYQTLIDATMQQHGSATVKQEFLKRLVAELRQYYERNSDSNVRLGKRPVEPVQLRLVPTFETRYLVTIAEMIGDLPGRYDNEGKLARSAA